MLEIELKFAVNDFTVLQKKMQSLGAELEDPYFEENKVFDTKDGHLREQGILLRLRKARGRSVLCLKRPAVLRSEQFKVQEEIEAMIKESWAIEQILESLELRVSFCYEKVREKWKIGESVVCLDLLPFGKYVEIEGQEEAIRAVARILDLDLGKGIKKNYHQLHQEYLAAHGLPIQTGFVFDEARKSELLASLSKSGRRI